MNIKILAVFSAILLCGCPKAARAQVPVTLNPYARQQFFDSSGRPLASGKVCTYQAGTTTPLATYTDSSGLYQNTNPVMLDAGGFGSLWLTASAYKFVLKTAGTDNTCATGAQQWVIDNVTPPPFLNGNNPWSGNETHAGTEVFNAAVTLAAGGSISGTIAGNPTFSGTVGFSGAVNTTSTFTATGGVTTDTITGTLTNGGILVMHGATGSGSNSGEEIILTGGTGGPTAGPGGAVSLVGGVGGGSGGQGGSVLLTSGSATSGNAIGGFISLLTGGGIGTGHGGDFSYQGGTGGATAARGGAISFTAGTGGAGGNGGDLSLSPGGKGAGGKDGSLILGGSGRLIYNVGATSVAPGCASTGLDTGGCTLANYSTDTSGTIILTAGATPLALGQITLTFNQTMGANGSFCMYTLISGNGTWDPRATVIGKSDGSLTSLALWDNNSVALTTADIYNIHYFCRGEN